MTEDITAILERPTCSVEELGRILGVSKNPAYDAVKRGDFPSIRIRGRGSKAIACRIWISIRQRQRRGATGSPLGAAMAS